MNGSWTSYNFITEQYNYDYIIHFARWTKLVSLWVLNKRHRVHHSNMTSNSQWRHECSAKVRMFPMKIWKLKIKLRCITSWLNAALKWIRSRTTRLTKPVERVSPRHRRQQRWFFRVCVLVHTDIDWLCLRHSLQIQMSVPAQGPWSATVLDVLWLAASGELAT